MKYSYQEHTISIKIRDNHSGHLWHYQIDTQKPEVNISKNGVHLRTVNHLVTPFGEAFLEELREGL